MTVSIPSQLAGVILIYPLETVGKRKEVPLILAVLGP
jgi:hypothetical protein